MLKGGYDVIVLRIFCVAFFILGVQGQKPQQEQIYTATACYGNVNNYLRLHCLDDKVIEVVRVIQAAKPTSINCITPATSNTYRKTCCRPEVTDCRIQPHDTVSATCNGHPQCDVMAMWSLVSKQCDQDIYPNTITYMQTDYKCVQLENPFTTAATTPTVTDTKTDKTNTTTEGTPTNGSSGVTPTTRFSLTSKHFFVVSHQKKDGDDTDIELTNEIVGAILAGTVGMFITLIVFIIYWRRRRRLRISGKPQTTVWDYLLNQTFTVRGERGYDHFSSCRSSASSEGDAKSPTIRKHMWLPNISPLEDTQSDVFNNSEPSHTLEFHQVGTPNPYAFLSLGVNASPAEPEPQQEA